MDIGGLRKPLAVHATWLTLLVLTVGSLPAQPRGESDEVTMTVGAAFTLDSKVLGEQRQVLISLPNEYAQGEARYPALVLLDGSPAALSLARASLFDQGIPDFVIAAVPNVDRIRDMSHRPIGEIWPTSGGADKFLAFLADELAPWLDASFRTTGYRVIHGGSAAGGLALYALLKRPEVFDATLARSPMLGTDYELFSELLAALPAEEPTPEHFLYVVYGSHDFPGVTVFVERFLRLLEATAPPWLRFEREVATGKGHYQVSGLNAGLTALYADNGFPTEDFLAEGAVAVTNRVAMLSQSFGSQVEAGTLSGHRAIIAAACDLSRQRRFADALRVLDYGLQLHPESPGLVYYMAQVLEHAGQEEEAMSTYRRVFELEPSAGVAGMTRIFLDNLEARAGRRVTGKDGAASPR